MNKKFIILFVIAIVLVCRYRIPIEAFENTDGVLDQIVNSYSELNNKFDNILSQDVTLNGKLSGPDLDFPAGYIKTLKTGWVELDGEWLNKKSIQKMKAAGQIGGYGSDGEGSTHLLIEGRHNLHNFPWGHNKWDSVFLLRGWNVTLYYDTNFSNKMTEDTNTNADIKMVRNVVKNRAQSYDLKWVGH